MHYLADTNILLRSSQPSHPMHIDRVKGVSSLIAKGETVCIIPQNIIEFWGVATRRPEENGLGFSVEQVQAEVSRIGEILTVLEDSPAIFPEWKKLVIAYSVQGKQVHDARLVAAMNVYGITHLLTYNKDHFKRFTGITTYFPSEV